MVPITDSSKLQSQAKRIATGTRSKCDTRAYPAVLQMLAGTLDPLDFGSPVQDMRSGQTNSGSEGSV